MAARTRKGITGSGWPVEVRERIQTSMLINRLSDHVVGKVELSPTQVRAAEILLRKTLADLSQIDGTLKVSHELSEMSDADLAAIAAGSSPRALIATDCPEEPDQIH
jgi:hypothetical protein|tara:strand:- start:1316 stop:1636 length:321 start_codon:yes stop_codon:yes gene_type:complete